MKVILPIQITDTILTSSTISEPYTTATPKADPAIWNSSTAYVSGNQVTVLSTHKIYEAVSNITGGDSPEISVTRVVPKWVEVGYNNRWAMFDTLRSSGTTINSATSITVVLTPGKSIDSMAILGMLNIANISITATSGGSTVYTNNINLITRDTNSWYTYFFGRFKFRNAITIFNLPSEYTDLVITITITGANTMEVGALVIGTALNIGKLKIGASVDALNFSTVNRDVFGNATLIQRRNVPKTNQQVYLDKSKLQSVLAAKYALDAVPAVWSALDDDTTNDYYNALLILGFYRTFDLDLDNPIGPTASIELEEV